MIEDIELVWKNCKKYNKADSAIYKMASRLEELTRETVKKLKLGADGREKEDDDSCEVTLSEKIEFTSNLKTLSKDKLLEYMVKAKKIAQNEISDMGDGKYRISIDKISKENFKRLKAEMEVVNRVTNGLKSKSKPN